MEKIIERDNLFSRRVRITLVAIPLFLVVVVLLLGFYTNLPIEKDTYYYTFSTIAQSIVALVAFLGAIVIFRVQRYESRRSELIEYLKKFGGNILRSDEQELKRAKDSLKNKTDDYSIGENEVENIVEEIDVIDFSSDTIKFKMVDFSLIAIFNAVFSIVGLFLTPWLTNLIIRITQNQVEYLITLGKDYLLFNVIFSCMALFYALIVILEIFKSISNNWVGEKKK